MPKPETITVTFPYDVLREVEKLLQLIVVLGINLNANGPQPDRAKLRKAFNLMAEAHLKPVRGKMVDIDKGMVPVIRWLLIFPTVETIACCEGDNEGTKPYLLFFAGNDDLKQILAEIYRPLNSLGDIMRYARCEVHYYGDGLLRYALSWPDNNTFEAWKAFLPSDTAVSE